MLEAHESGFFPNRIIARDSQRALTSEQLLARSRRLAGGLAASGIRVLVLHGDNGLDWLSVDFACRMAAVCLVPLPTFFSAEQLEYALASMPVDAVISDQIGIWNRLAGSIRRRQPAICGRLDLILLDGRGPDCALPPGTRKVTFTSGSTAAPKGVCLSSGQLQLQARALVDAVQIERPRHLCLLPLSLLLENVAGVYAPLLAGGEVIVPGLAEIGFTGSSGLDAGAFINMITRHNPDSLILTPRLLAVLEAAAAGGWPVPASLKYAAVGGGVVSAELVARSRCQGIPVYQGYGLSECASVVTLNTPRRCNHESCGYPLAHLDVAVENGEIVVAGNPMLGYAGEPASWGRGRIYTGDLGRLDDAGFLHIDGRRSDLLISSYGRNIHPEWVESRLLDNPGITECVLFGDDRPYCTALLSSRWHPDEDDRIQQIIDRANAGLPDYARVTKWGRFPTPLSETKSLVTENGRPRRRLIAGRYRVLIDSLYAGTPESRP